MTREQRSVQYNVALGPNHRDQIFFTADTLTGGIVVCVCLLPVVAYLYIETGVWLAACGVRSADRNSTGVTLPALPRPLPAPRRRGALLWGTASPGLSLLPRECSHKHAAITATTVAITHGHDAAPLPIRQSSLRFPGRLKLLLKKQKQNPCLENT